MKSIVLYVGLGLLSINLIAFFIISGFGIYAFIASEVSIISSLLLSLWLVKSKMDDAFKIFAFFAMGMALMAKYIAAHYTTDVIKDSIPLLILVGIITTEILSIVAFKYISKHG